VFAKVIADRYVRAFLGSIDPSEVDNAENELETISAMLKGSDEIRAYLENPKVPPAIKKQVLERSLKDKFSRGVLNLLLLLIDKRRQDIIIDVADRFNETVDAERGIEHAIVISAVPLDENLQGTLTRTVQQFSEREVDVGFRTDPNLIGGVVIRLGDRVIDASLSKRFEDIRRAMLAVRLPRSS
jgi:F-type H+-transporting ATPase subunit delta